MREKLEFNIKNKFINIKGIDKTYSSVQQQLTNNFRNRENALHIALGKTTFKQKFKVTKYQKD